LDRKKERENWAKIEKTIGYYEKGAITKYMAWGIKKMMGLYFIDHEAHP
jgi:hypothetical protein